MGCLISSRCVQGYKPRRVTPRSVRQASDRSDRDCNAERSARPCAMVLTLRGYMLAHVALSSASHVRRRRALA
eukprot:15462444-Alexandrium_andersonii.AAC.1